MFIEPGDFAEWYGTNSHPAEEYTNSPTGDQWGPSREEPKLVAASQKSSTHRDFPSKQDLADRQYALQGAAR